MHPETEHMNHHLRQLLHSALYLHLELHRGTQVMLRYGVRDDASLLLQATQAREPSREVSRPGSSLNGWLTVSLNPPTCVLCLLRQYGFVMGEARGEANKHDCNRPLPASLPASLPATLPGTLRAAEPFAELDPEAEPEAEPADAPEPATEAQVAAAVAAAAAAADGGSYAPCKRQRGGEPEPGAGLISE